jgi:hypothetical protein
MTTPDAITAAYERGRRDERTAWEKALGPLIDAGAFEGATFDRCENCGAMLTLDEHPAISDVTGCWRYLTGRDKDPCAGDDRKCLTMLLAERSAVVA